MSSRPQAAPYSVIGGTETNPVSGDMSANIISKPTIIQKLSMIGYDISWSGSSPSGVMSVQVSNTYAENADGTVKTAGNWTTLTLSTSPIVSGNSGSGFIDVDATGAYAMRLVYTRTSGTGTMHAVITAKVA
jgi:hypothetical protein